MSGLATFFQINPENQWVEQIWSHIGRWMTECLAIPQLKIVGNTVIAAIVAARDGESSTVVLDREVISVLKHLPQKISMTQILAMRKVLDTRQDYGFSLEVTTVSDFPESPVVVVKYTGRKQVVFQGQDFSRPELVDPSGEME